MPLAISSPTSRRIAAPRGAPARSAAAAIRWRRVPAGWLLHKTRPRQEHVILLGNGKLTTGYWESNSTTSCAFTLQTASLPDGLVGHIVAVQGKPAHSLPRHKLISMGAFRGLERPI